MNDKSKAGVAAGLGVAAGYGLGKLTGPKPTEAAPSGTVALDDDAMELLAAIRDAINNLAGVPGGPIPIALKNPDSLIAFQLVIPVAGRGYQLPGFPVPYDMEVVVKSIPGNAGNIFIARSQADVVNVNTRYLLIQNEGVGLKVDNTDAIWVDAAVVNDAVVVIVEQKTGGD